jgi:hypothetical protein
MIQLNSLKMKGSQNDQESVISEGQITFFFAFFRQIKSLIEGLWQTAEKYLNMSMKHKHFFHNFSVNIEVIQSI